MSRKAKPENAGGKTRDVNAAQRVQLALSLRAQRLGWDEIATRAGYASRGAAHNAVMRELERTVVDKVDELRREELSVLDQLQSEIWPLAMDKENKGRLFAVDRLLTISEHRRKLLNIDARPDEQNTQQNYTKKVILTHQTPTEGVQ